MLDERKKVLFVNLLRDILTGSIVGLARIVQMLPVHVRVARRGLDLVVRRHNELLVDEARVDGGLHVAQVELLVEDLDLGRGRTPAGIFYFKVFGN